MKTPFLAGLISLLLLGLPMGTMAQEEFDVEPTPTAAPTPLPEDYGKPGAPGVEERPGPEEEEPPARWREEPAE